MAEAWAGEQGDAGRVDGLLGRILRAPIWLGIGVFLAIAALYLSSAAALGQIDLLRDAEQPLGLNSSARFDLVTTILIAYTLVVGRAGRRAAVRDLFALRPILALSERGHAEIVRDAETPDRRRVALACTLGAAFGVALELAARALTEYPVDPGLPGASFPSFLGFLPLWGTLLNVTLFALLGWMALLSLTYARRFSELGRTRTVVRLLDHESRAPFARIGLRQAIYWFVGSSIASLLMLEAVAPGLVLLVLIVTLTLGVVALLLPARGIRSAVRAARSRELAWVRQSIEDERGALASPPAEAPGAGARLPALLAYEARIDAVREWPFDAPTMLRFTLFLLLPLASWVASALVERLLDWMLG